MSLRRVIVYVDEVDKERRRKVEKDVSNVLATYANSVLAEVDQDQIDSLKRQGLRLEIQGKKMIRLRTVEFDPADGAPSPPPTLSLSAAEIRRRRNYWIVQFVGPVKVEWGEEIRARGGSLHGYIPDNAVLADMTSQIKEKVEKLPFVNWVGLYEPAYKISPLLMGRRKRASPSEFGTLAVKSETFKPGPEGNINVVLHSPTDLEKVSQEISRLGGTIVATGKNLVRASLDLSNLDKLVRMVEVKWVEPYAVPKINNDIAAQIINVQPVWNRHGIDGDGQIVGVADSGLDTGANDSSMHDDLEGRIVAIHDLAGDGADDPLSGHGTHTSGSILGNGARSNGNIRGMAYAARLVFQAFTDHAGGSLTGIPADLNTLFLQAYNDGARIHSNSWGGAYDIWGNPLHGQYTAQSQDIDEFVWNHKDMCILFAAGNGGQDADSDGVVDGDSLNVHACAKNCITVGCTENNRPSGSTPPPGYDIPWGTGSWAARYPVNPINGDHVSDDPEGMAAFSSRGPTDDGRVKPDVVAPGTNVLSVRSSVASGTGWGLLPASDPRRPYYMYMGGTSMATPLTTGTIALIRQYLMNACLHTDPSAALLKAILIHGAHPLTGQYTPPEVGAVPDSNQGWGRADLEGSLFPDYPVKMEFKDDPADLLEYSGDHKEFSFNVVNSTVPFRATLVWTDYRSTLAAGGGLVNTLRLSVTAADGTIEQGLPNNSNVQQVVIDNPQTGEYKVRVDAINIDTYVSPVAVRARKQDFALVISGGLEFVDVFIKDNDADNGMEPSTGTLARSPDIWVSLENDPSAPKTTPKYGQTNYVFVRVRNRGSRATGKKAEVKLYWAYRDVSQGLSRPNWQAIGNVQHVNVPAHSATGEGEVTTDAFEWIPPRRGLFCFFATVNHPEDPILQEDFDVVRWEDNLAQRYADIRKPCCIIAAVSGSRLLPHVQFLREFRDEIVLKSMFKTLFERLLDHYYRFSPSIARKMEEISQFRKFVKYSIVYPFVFCAKAVAFLALAVRSK